MYLIMFRKKEEADAQGFPDEGKWAVLENAQADEDSERIAKFLSREKALDRIMELAPTVGTDNLKLLRVIAMDWMVKVREEADGQEAE